MKQDPKLLREVRQVIIRSDNLKGLENARTYRYNVAIEPDSADRPNT